MEVLLLEPGDFDLMTLYKMVSHYVKPQKILVVSAGFSFWAALSSNYAASLLASFQQEEDAK